MKLDKNLYKELEEIYDKDPSNKIISNAISNVGIREASLNKNVINKHNFIFSNEIKTNDVTDQKKTGRCWMFAGLNMIRMKIAENLNMENFELSESYLYFFDNMEKTNRFLQRIIDTKDLDIKDRRVEDVLFSEPNDGGYFEFFYYLIKKYGIVPKTAMGELFNSQNSFYMFYTLERALKKIAVDIRKSDDKKEIEDLRKKGLSYAYNIFTKSIGKPVEKFDFKYYDKDHKYHIEKDMTPKLFFEKYVGDFFDNKVKLLNDPRHPYNRVLVDTMSKNAVDLEDLKGINIDMDTMSKIAQKSIKDGETMWFACDVDINEDRESGILDENLFNLKDTFINYEDMTKAERIDARFSTACHAMNLTGFDKRGKKINYWKIENSWGDENGHDGYFSMTDEWFRENTFEIIVDKKYLTQKVLKAMDKKEIVYDEFDPMYRMLKNIR
ncbi:C1 family peptidase [Anaerococcus porci]|uniref:aminopeptidase C n=1 Tax=Anaerococcus porci TaxID=2652269 RepID=UPI002A765983|nr:C1 family peptidase [Anaerococcus porci]MDY3007299.1 C1 family peptidase [Anaerococcus porci]